jgi:hypothetical protein
MNLEVTEHNNRANGGGSWDHASRHGIIKVTADNGYTVFVNGDKVGSGGAALLMSDPVRLADKSYYLFV